MTEAEHAAWLTSLVTSIGVNVLLPLVMLGLMVWLFWVLLARAQSDPQFDIATIFRDDGGKVSMTQVLKLAAFGVHAFMSIIVIVTSPQESGTVLSVFAGTWGPVTAALEFIKRKWPIQQGQQ